MPLSASYALSPCTSARSSRPASSNGTFSVLPLVLRGSTKSEASVSLMVSAIACPYTGKPPPGVAVPRLTLVLSAAALPPMPTPPKRTAKHTTAIVPQRRAD